MIKLSKIEINIESISKLRQELYKCFPYDTTIEWFKTDKEIFYEKNRFYFPKIKNFFIDSNILDLLPKIFKESLDKRVLELDIKVNSWLMLRCELSQFLYYWGVYKKSSLDIKAIQKLCENFVDEISNESPQNLYYVKINELFGYKLWYCIEHDLLIINSKSWCIYFISLSDSD